MDPDEPLGLSNAATVVEVGEDGASLLVGEPAIEEGRALAFGEAFLASAAGEHAALLRAVAEGDAEVVQAAFAVVGALGVLAAEVAEVVHGANLRGERKIPCLVTNLS